MYMSVYCVCTNWLQVPDKKPKATVEKAVDTLKEKKKKLPEAVEKVRAQSHIYTFLSKGKGAWPLLCGYTFLC